MIKYNFNYSEFFYHHQSYKIYNNNSVIMGTENSRVIVVEDVQSKLAICQLIQQKKCSVYGSVHFIRYKGNQFYLGQSQTNLSPHLLCIHYLIQPNLLLIPQFTLLEDTCPESLDSLLNVISGIAQMGINQPLGIGHGRIAYSGRWGIAGQKNTNWAYQQILKGDSQGVYLSPQLMIAFSQRKSNPTHNQVKSDIFTLGIMLIEIIFQQCLHTIYDYDNFSIKLKPILQKLNLIRNQFGQAVYEIFISMLQIQEDDRVQYSELFQLVNNLKKPKMLSSYMNNSNNTNRNMENSKQKMTPRNILQTNRTTKTSNTAYANNVSPFRTRFQDQTRVPEKLGKSPDRARVQRQNGISRSPLRRDLKINTRFDKQNKNYGKTLLTQQMYQLKSTYSPISRK